jgi:hypothetical protein
MHIIIGVISSEVRAVSTVVNLLEFAKQPIPKCPLLPEFSLHWYVDMCVYSYMYMCVFIYTCIYIHMYI